MSWKMERFHIALVGASAHKEYVEALKEWVNLEKPVSADEVKVFCICGTRIWVQHSVRNRINRNTLIIGSCCIHKFGIENPDKRKKAPYIELCSFGCTNITEQRFMETMLMLIRDKESVPKWCLQLSLKEIAMFEKLSGKRWRWYHTLC